MCVEGNIASGKSHFLDCFKNNNAVEVSDHFCFISQSPCSWVRQKCLYSELYSRN